MVIKKAELMDMLNCREKRAAKQTELINKYKKPVVCICMNIAGDVKRTPGIDILFRHGCEAYEAEVAAMLNSSAEQAPGRRPGAVYRELVFAHTGPEAFYVFDTEDAELLKDAGIKIEETGSEGRLFDIDIIGTDGQKLSRPAARRCIVCGGPVADCARSRAHGLDVIKAAANAIIADFLCEKLADSVCEALKAEAKLSPKPGLVDSLNSGAHKDMDLPMLLASAEALRPFFARFAREFACGDKSLESLIKTGVEAEKAMFKATGGVNTHKGAIFAFALYIAAIAKSCFDGSDVLETVKELAAQKASSMAGSGAKNEEKSTHGDEVRSRYGAKGAVEDALQGFPMAHMAGAILAARKTGSSEDAQLYVLCRIMAELDDSNVLYRAGQEGLDWVKQQAESLLEQTAEDRKASMAELNAEFVQRNISSGGAADMLALGIFLAEYSDLLYTES